MFLLDLGSGRRVHDNRSVAICSVAACLWLQSSSLCMNFVYMLP